LSHYPKVLDVAFGCTLWEQYLPDRMTLPTGRLALTAMSYGNNNLQGHFLAADGG
jgi:hypothetical protein